MINEWKEPLLVIVALLTILTTLSKWGQRAWKFFFVSLPYRLVVAPAIAPLQKQVGDLANQVASLTRDNDNLWKLVLGDQHDSLVKKHRLERNSPLSLMDIRTVLTEVGYKPKQEVMEVFREVVKSGLTREGEIASFVVDRLGWAKLQQEADELKLTLAECMAWWVFCTQQAAEIGGAEEVFRKLGMIE